MSQKKGTSFKFGEKDRERLDKLSGQIAGGNKSETVRIALRFLEKHWRSLSVEELGKLRSE